MGKQVISKKIDLFDILRKIQFSEIYEKEFYIIDIIIHQHL